MDRIYKSVWDKVENGGLIKRVLFKFAVYYKQRWIPRGGDTPFFNRLVMSSITGLLGMSILLHVHYIGEHECQIDQ